MTRVLVVEDDPQTAEEIRAALSDHGFAVESAVNGRDGLLKAAAQNIEKQEKYVTSQSLGKPDSQMTLAPIKQYYLANGGTEEKWPEWATAKMKAGEISNHRMPPTFALW